MKPSGSRVVPRGGMDRRTDMMKIIVAFRNFANAPKKWNRGCSVSGLQWKHFI